jgi:LPXTG-motif cell wall-anchored protein
MSRLGAAALITLFAMSIPGSALAQSVGDDQYRDPFAGQDQGQDESAQQDGTSAPAPAPAPAPTTSAPTASAPATDPVTGEPIATVADTLPRTGSEADWVAAAGLFLIAAGVALRRTARA